MDVVSHASSFPMMSERRVVIVRDADKLLATEINRDLLLRYLEHPLPTTILVLVAPRADMRMAVFKAFQQRGIATEFKPLYENLIPGWIMNRVETYGRTITPEASQLMQSYVGRSLREIHNEIEKLLIYVDKKKMIDTDEVHAVVGISKKYNIFEMQKAIGQGDLSLSLEILEHMIDAGESPLGMIVMLTRYFQKLFIVPSLWKQVGSEYGLASALGVSPYFVKEYLSASQRFPPARIEQAFSLLLDADVTLKSSPENPKVVMTSLLYKLIKAVEEAVAY
jgi:DNA polymerase-3 subunit delta